MHARLKLTFMAASVLAGSYACSSHDFGSSTVKSSDGVAAAAAGAAAGAGAGAGGQSQAAAGTDANAVGNGAGPGTDQGAAGGPAVAAGLGGPGQSTLTTDQAQCLNRKAGLYNIVFVFDISGSQAQTDPTNLRISGAKEFLGKLSAYADANPSTHINVAISGFAADAVLGAHHWQALSKATLATVDGDVDTVTASRKAGTVFLKGLGAAGTLLTEQKTTASDKSQRNFVIFATDGEPNGKGTLAEIDAAAAALTTAHGAAMIMLGTGTGVSSKGEAILKDMALPLTGIVNPKHIGQYHRVSTPAEMATIGSLLTADVAKCE